jgi:hypothetical protein
MIWPLAWRVFVICVFFGVMVKIHRRKKNRGNVPAWLMYGNANDNEPRRDRIARNK